VCGAMEEKDKSNNKKGGKRKNGKQHEEQLEKVSLLYSKTTNYQW